MGLISKILSVARNRRNGVLITELKNDPGGGANTTMGQFSTPGIDAQPLPGDYAVSVSVPGSKREAAIGTIDPGNDPVSNPGEIRLYARDASGNVITYGHFKNDGTLELNGNTDNAVRYVPLETMVDELRTDFNEFVKAFNAHTHSYLPGPGPATNTAGPTAIPTPLIPVAETSIDITPAKVDEVKLP